MNSEQLTTAMTLISVLAAELMNKSALVARAQSENRNFTPEEWALITKPSEVAIATLEQDIAIRKNQNSAAPAPTTQAQTTVTHPRP